MKTCLLKKRRKWFVFGKSEMSNREGRGWDVENEGSLYDS